MRGYNISIDTSSNPAVVGATRPLTTTPSSYNTVNTVLSVACDSSGNLYVLNAYVPNLGSGTVSVFAPGATTATATLVVPLGSGIMTFDATGNLYVCNSNGGTNTVSEFAPGSTTATAILTGLNNPYGLAIDGSGNLYVANAGNGTVSEFAPGSTTPTATLTGLDGPIALAFDTSGNLYVANDANPGTVSEFARQAPRPPPPLRGWPIHSLWH